MTRRGLAGVIFLLFTVDMLFLPMFHIGPLPWKPGYVLLLAYTPYALRLRRGWPLLVACAGLLLATWAGALYLAWIDPRPSFAVTARNSIVFALAPLAYTFGWRNRSRSIDFLYGLIPLYFLLNAVLTYGYQRMPWLVTFYGLEDRVTAGLFDVRSPGIHYNPNLSALAVNLMLLGIVASDRARPPAHRSQVTRWLVFLSVIGTHVLMGSRGEMLAALVLGVFWFAPLVTGNVRRRLLMTLGAAVLAVAICGSVLYLFRDFLSARSTAFEFVRHQFTSSLTLMPADVNDSVARQNSLLMRPFLQGVRIWDRFVVSPLWGTGFDAGTAYPFEDIYFHNDWAVVLTAGGIVGFVCLIAVARISAAAGMCMLVPFLLTAPANSFIFAPQHLMFYLALAGYVTGRRRRHALQAAPVRTPSPATVAQPALDVT